MTKTATKIKTKEKPVTVEPLTNFQKGTPQSIAWEKGEKEKKASKLGTHNDPSAEKPAPKVATSITKVKIVEKDFLLVDYSRIEADGSISDHPGESYDKRYMHPDTRELFSDLRIHLALLCGYFNPKKVKTIDDWNDELLEPYHVTAVSIKSGEGYTITGHRINDYGKAVILNSPYALFEQDEKSAYKFTDEVYDTIESLQKEVIKYLNGTKVGKDPQGKLDFPETNHENKLA